MNSEYNQADLITRVAKLEEWAKGSERRTQKLENDNETMNRLIVLVELQQRSMDIMNETLLKINDSNINIKHEIEVIKGNVADVKVNVDKVTLKVEGIESTDNLNIPKALKSAAGWFFAAIVAGIASYVLINFGFKK